MKIKMSKEVELALKEGRHVVALESTIISHGMPYPQNVETALKVEATVRKYGGIPATIGIINGECVVGMTEEEVEEFGKRKGIIKVSRRDLPVVMAMKMWGATTVATTMILAEKAGINLFVTGGIGGVHRGATETFDISADLDELGKTNVAVICAGAKAILDLPLTLEYLETKGVPVLGNQTTKLPAFYTRESDLNLDYCIETPEDFAKIIKAKYESGLQGGIVIANPIPKEHSMDKDYMNKIITEAIKEMEEEGIRGKDSTPYLLQAVKDKTNGKSLDANIHLILNNAKLGGQIAKALDNL